jgi:hypothetical protein
MGRGRYESSADFFKQLGDIEVPPQMLDLFAAIPEERFRIDLLLPELRANGKGLLAA